MSFLLHAWTRWHRPQAGSNGRPARLRPSGLACYLDPRRTESVAQVFGETLKTTGQRPAPPFFRDWCGGSQFARLGRA